MKKQSKELIVRAANHKRKAWEIYNTAQHEGELYVASEHIGMASGMISAIATYEGMLYHEVEELVNKAAKK